MPCHRLWHGRHETQPPGLSRSDGGYPGQSGLSRFGVGLSRRDGYPTLTGISCRHGISPRFGINPSRWISRGRRSDIPEGRLSRRRPVYTAQGYPTTPRDIPITEISTSPTGLYCARISHHPPRYPDHRDIHRRGRSVPLRDIPSPPQISRSTRLSRRPDRYPTISHSRLARSDR